MLMGRRQIFLTSFSLATTTSRTTAASEVRMPVMSDFLEFLELEFGIEFLENLEFL
jgi:hypothetical protein